jgi:cysteine-rich repeat protein
MADWAQDPPQMAGTCSYQGRIAGAPVSFPCTELEKFSLEVWGCLNTSTPQGLQVKSFLLSHGLSTGYLVAPTYASSLTSAQVVNLQALVVDASVSAASAQFASPVSIAASSFADEVMLRNFLLSVEQCFESNFQSESVCGCTTSANCNQGAGEVCVSNQCQKSTGALAACPFVKFSQNPEPQPCCGDGQVESGAGETCDDGNRNNGDGCSSDCHAEVGPAACCTPSGCVDMEWKTAARCTTLQGNLMSGTCAQLNQCGYVVQGSCVDKDELCHQPVTAEQCTRLYEGTFQATPCSSKNP